MRISSAPLLPVLLLLSANHVHSLALRARRLSSPAAPKGATFMSTGYGASNATSTLEAFPGRVRYGQFFLSFELNLP